MANEIKKQQLVNGGKRNALVLLLFLLLASPARATRSFSSAVTKYGIENADRQKGLFTRN